MLMHDSLPMFDDAAVSKPSPKRKPGRPRKAKVCLMPIGLMPTGAPIAETPQETAAGGGQVPSDNHSPVASPHSNEIGSNAVADETGQSRGDDHMRLARPSAPRIPPSVAVGGGQSWDDPQGKLASPTTNTASTVIDAGGGGEVRAKEEMTTIAPLPDLAFVIEEIQQLQRKRIFCMKSDFRQSNATMAEIRRLLGWSRDNAEAENKKINKRAMNLVKYVEAEQDEQAAQDELDQLADEAPDKLKNSALTKIKKAQAVQDKCDLSLEDMMIASEHSDIIIASQHGREVWTTLIAKSEKRMKELAKDLPIYMWAQGVRGLGEIGIATIIGETGALSNYATKERVWKRLGLAVINGNRQGSPGRKATAEDWIEHGYAKQRRSQCWKINDSLIRAQWRGAKEDEETGEVTAGYALGPYGELYARQKAEEHRRNDAGEYAATAGQIVDDCKARRTKPPPENLAGRLTKKHLDNKARRIVEKQLIEDIWREWNRPRQEFT